MTALLLDLDGTLIDSQPGILESYRHASAEAMPGQALDEASIVIGPPLPQMFKNSFPGAQSGDIDRLVKTFRQHYAEKGLFKTVFYEGVFETLGRLHQKGIALSIATNKPLRLTTAILDYLKVSPLFQHVLSVDSIEPPFAGKAAMIAQLQKNLAARFYVGDTGEDAAAAAECGLQFIWASYGYGNSADARLPAAHRVLRRFSEVEEVLR